MAAAADSGGGSSGEKTIVLVSSDNNARFEVREAAALLSQTVRRMIDEAGADDASGGDGIPLPDVDARTLAKVLEYCNKHAPASSSSSAAPPAEGEDLVMLESFDREFMRVDIDTIFSLTTAASYLKIEGLLKLTCQTIADMIKGKTPEQIREMFGIPNEFTPEEEELLRRENAWAF